MQTRRTRTKQKQPRAGFTLIELLVVISIIAVLAALILPGIQNAREAARRTQCMSQMRNVSVALHSYATSHNGQLPYLRGEFNITYPGPVVAPAPWSVQLLPFLEATALYERLQVSVPGGGPNDTQALLATSIQAYTCPDDLDSESAGTLSFVANAGYTTGINGGGGGWSTLIGGTNGAHTVQGYDWAFNGLAGGTRTLGDWDTDDDDVTKGTGVFFQEGGSGGFRSTLDLLSTGDGQTQTIVFSENLQATIWGTSAIAGMAFVAPVLGTSLTEVSDSSAANGMGPNDTNQKELALTYRDGSGLVTLNYSVGTPFTNAKINANLGAASEGGAPRPSSFHPGVVNVFFGDGHGVTVSQTIDDTVYVRLVSSRGERHGQDILSDNSF